MVIDYKIQQQKDFFKITFSAMACPCEVLVYTRELELVERVAIISSAEACRVEQRFSRYQKGNLCWQMNHSRGSAIDIDDETHSLLQYAEQLFHLSEGKFDITSGILRKIWSFSIGSKPPSQKEIDRLLPCIDFSRVQYDQSTFILPPEMEIDFGGIGKEYCVDRVVALITPLCESKSASFLVNFGGDLSAVNYNQIHPPWVVGLEDVVEEGKAATVIEVSQGAIATSGSTKRVFEYNGNQYAHILNPMTGSPVVGAPRSVSVFAQSCSLAGGMSTLAQLQGKQAEQFLQQNKVKYICCW